ncbi:MAG: DUF4058 family protein [Planctomycetota bacterium]|nr:DUF4058 family protein [Planctomycetota bacterium]
MSSPFPGMNPYLEQEDVWEDFHGRFIPLAAEWIGAQIEPAYIVKMGVNVYIREPPYEQRVLLGRPDVMVADRQPARPAAGGSATIEAPAYARIIPAVDICREPYLEICDRQSRQVVTALELLRPTNKRPGPDREQYLHKRRQFFQARVNLVELDLLRGGPRLPLEDLPACDYYALVARPEEHPRAAVWPIRLRDALPTIPIPLRPPDDDARLDLQAVLQRVYDAAGYRHYVYEGSPKPPLPKADQAWAAELARHT